jgi:hypothetical protein
LPWALKPRPSGHSRNQLGQDLIFRLDLPFRVGDPLPIRGVVPVIGAPTRILFSLMANPFDSIARRVLLPSGSCLLYPAEIPRAKPLPSWPLLLEGGRAVLEELRLLRPCCECKHRGLQRGFIWSWREKDFRGMSIPYARSLPWVITNSVNRVPGKPKMKLITFHNVVPFPCARIAVKLKFAKIQIADTPPFAAGESDEVISIDSARQGNTTDATANAHGRRAQRSKKSQRVKKVNISLTILTPWRNRSPILPGRAAFTDPPVRAELAHSAAAAASGGVQDVAGSVAQPMESPPRAPAQFAAAVPCCSGGNRSR